MIQALLDETYLGLSEGQTGAALAYLQSGLGEVRRRLSPADWRRLVDAVCLPHPLTELIHEDPLMGGAYRLEGRHIPGGMLQDYVYYRSPINAHDVTALGHQLFFVNVNSAISRAIRYRRRYIARFTDRVAAMVFQPRVLAISPGHLREAEMAFSLGLGRIGEFIALGDNRAELARIDHAYGLEQPEQVRTLYGSPHAVAQGDCALTDLAPGRFDFIYSANFFNLLPTPEAATFMLRMWEALAPGGRLLVANGLPDFCGAAYLDCYVGWDLNYRTEQELVQLVHALPRHEIDDLTLESDPDRAIGFLTVRKRE